jgi:hypothetical protein
MSNNCSTSVPEPTADTLTKNDKAAPTGGGALQSAPTGGTLLSAPSWLVRPASDAVTVPLVRPGTLTEVERAIYRILGIETVVVIGERSGGKYTVLANYFAEAVKQTQVIEDAAGPVAVNKTLAMSTVNVPICQVGISDLIRDVYAALGVQVASVAAEGVRSKVLTVLTSEYVDAVPIMAQMTGGTVTMTGCVLPPATPVVSPERSVKINPRFQESYREVVPEPIEVLARLFGLRYVVFWTGNQRPVYVLKGVENLSDVLRRAGFDV